MGQKILKSLLIALGGMFAVLMVLCLFTAIMNKLLFGHFG